MLYFYKKENAKYKYLSYYILKLSLFYFTSILIIDKLLNKSGLSCDLNKWVKILFILLYIFNLLNFWLVYVRQYFLINCLTCHLVKFLLFMRFVNKITYQYCLSRMMISSSICKSSYVIFGAFFLLFSYLFN